MAKGRMIVIAPNGMVTSFNFDDNRPSLAEVQAGLGGYVEPVPHWMTYEGEPCEAYCNEDGKLQRMAQNDKATLLWLEQISEQARREEIREDWNDYLVGPIVILTGVAMWANAPEDENE